jgi:hypothetical protein
MKRIMFSVVLTIISMIILLATIAVSRSSPPHSLNALTAHASNDNIPHAPEISSLGLQLPLQINLQQNQIATHKNTSAGELPWDRTSDYMLGTIAVAIILPQCTSSISCTESWTSDEIMQVHTEIEIGLQWWEQKATEAGVTVDFQIVPGHPITVSVNQEAIRHPGGNSSSMCGNEEIWIDPIMASLGFNDYPATGNQYLHEVREYDNYLRNTYATDWAFVAFVADASSDAAFDPDDGDAGKGLFRLTTCGGTVAPFGVSGYGWATGPHMVMNNVNNGYGTHFMDGVAAMEIAHIFGAPDEWGGYGACMPPGEGPSCDYPWGYLHVPNGNCNYLNDPDTQTCMLNDNLSLLRHPEDYGTGIIHNTVNTYTQGHLGWWDTDKDGWADPIDTIPVVTLTEYLPDPDSDRTPTFSGRVQDTPFHTTNYTDYVDITINDVVAQYRVDGGNWHTAIPTDGAFDSFDEVFSFTPLLCQNRQYFIEVRGVNTVGNISPIITDSLTISSTTICQNLYLPLLCKSSLP